MARDLLGDLKGPGDDQDNPPPPYKEDKKSKKAKANSENAGNGVPSEKYAEELEGLRNKIAKIESNINEIEQLHAKAINAVTEEQNSVLSEDLDMVMGETNKLGQQIRNKLKALEVQNKQLKGKNDIEYKIRAGQYSAVIKKFMDVMEKYKNLQQNYQQKYKQKLKRQLLVVKPNATDDEIEKVVENGDAGPIFAQGMFTAQQLEAQQVLEDIQNKHEDIVKIERSIIELQQLFMDMAVLVSAQAEILDRIENHVVNVVNYTEDGVVSLRKANKLQKSARKKKCIIFFCLIIILVVIAVVFGVIFGKK